MKRQYPWLLVPLAIVVLASCQQSEPPEHDFKKDVAAPPELPKLPAHPKNGGAVLPPPLANGGAAPLPLPDEYEISIEGPKVMLISSKSIVRVMVSTDGDGFIADETTQVLQENIEAHSRELQASVHGGSAFSVEPTPGERKTMIGNAVQWIFTVTALEGGKHKLYVEITQFVGDSKTSEPLKDTFPIVVSVNTVSFVRDYLATHLPETIGGGIVLIVGTVFVVVAARMRKKAGLSPDPDANKSGEK